MVVIRNKTSTKWKVVSQIGSITRHLSLKFFKKLLVFIGLILLFKIWKKSVGYTCKKNLGSLQPKPMTKFDVMIKKHRNELK